MSIPKQDERTPDRHPSEKCNARLRDVPKMIAGAPDIADGLATFVNYWGLDAYTPPDGIRESVRGIVTLALNESRAAALLLAEIERLDRAAGVAGE